jgi:RHS repeat-associated protein
VSPELKSGSGYENFQNRYQYTGREKDFINFYNYRTRYYSDGLGIFSSIDLIFNPNLYIYANNNPVIFSDAEGLWSEINRKRTEPRAKVCASKDNDSIEDLSRMARLDPDEVDKWLRYEDGDNPFNKEGKIVGGTTYTVPNIIIMSVGDLSPKDAKNICLQILAAIAPDSTESVARGVCERNRTSIRLTYEIKGYLVYDVDGPFLAKTYIEKSTDLWGFWFIGHSVGEAPEKVKKNEQNKLTAQKLLYKVDSGTGFINSSELKPHHKLGLIWLNACNTSAHNLWRNVLKSKYAIYGGYNGTAFPVDPGYWIEGADEEVK